MHTKRTLRRLALSTVAALALLAAGLPLALPRAVVPAHAAIPQPLKGPGGGWNGCDPQYMDCCPPGYTQSWYDGMTMVLCIPPGGFAVRP